MIVPAQVASGFLTMKGLRNHHLSCCVNTLLQTFSATRELTDILDKWKPSGRTADKHSLPLQLKTVLSAMRSDDPHSVSHHGFLYCLDRNYIRLNVQHDADEVFLSILNLMQQQIGDTALALEIQELYKISVQTQLECLECSFNQTQTSFMLSLPLHIKEDDNSLESCMTSFFEHQELKGRNCCYCKQCGSKTPSKQGVKLLSLPPILRVHLKRFRNNSGYARKIDCKVTFPETFDFTEIVKEAFSSDFTQNDCTYTLYAVLVHSGGAMYGHYTAFVRHRANQRWHYANDSHVQQASWEEVMATYGGYNRSTAYMLMYRRGSEAGGPQPDLSG
ncbi:ubl carboxyl-terminal hydrolase 18 isoform X2 [Notolabrus celidotus]|uniref:ubl carboxyl-terminal hydrolase 18 isoform X2 n=1 Tax=Notolabrus celidotus TaxID=1203425 RepID=UPI00148FA0CD|nr:ubl carboxyl-terminal hydrolase 18 isoform X2 [Notolabrus celidotus]